MIGRDTYYKLIRKHKELYHFLVYRPMPLNWDEYNTMVVDYMENLTPRLVHMGDVPLSYPCMIKDDLKLDLVDTDVHCPRICPLMVSSVTCVCMGGILNCFPYALRNKRDDIYYDCLFRIRDFKFYPYQTMLNKIKELNDITKLNDNLEVELLE